MANAIFLLILGGAILIAGGELLVRGATRLATLFGIPPLVIGLTIVAICTGAPEMAVSLSGALGHGSADIAVGNVVGSNICNILLVLGLSSLAAPIAISSRLVKREIPFLIFVSFLVWIFGFVAVRETADGPAHFFPQWGGFVFLVMLIAYNIWVVHSVRSGHHAEASEAIESDYGKKGGKRRFFAELLLSLVLLFVGLGMLIYGSNEFIDGAIQIAKLLGVSELVISLTVLAVGTSLPELIVSLVAAFRGKHDIAIGNIIGSNTFNLLGILGLSTAVTPGGLALSRQAYLYDIPIMAIVAVLGSVLCITGRRLSRFEGAILLLGYAGYVAFLFVGNR